MSGFIELLGVFVDQLCSLEWVIWLAGPPAQFCSAHYWPGKAPHPRASPTKPGGGSCCSWRRGGGAGVSSTSASVSWPLRSLASEVQSGGLEVLGFYLWQSRIIYPVPQPSSVKCCDPPKFKLQGSRLIVLTLGCVSGRVPGLWVHPDRRGWEPRLLVSTPEGQESWLVVLPGVTRRAVWWLPLASRQALPLLFSLGVPSRRL